MARNNNRSGSTTTNARGGRQTKAKGEAANIAPEGTESAETPVVAETPEADPAAEVTEEPTVEQPAEVVAADQDASDPVAPETTDDGNPEVEAPLEAPAPETTDTPTEQLVPTEGEQSAPEQAAAPEAKDPFADLPETTIGDYKFRDLTLAETSNPRKYESVQAAAREQRLPIKPNWKHATAMITIGSHQREFRAGSVYGTIDQIVREYGRAGIPAYMLVTKLRQAQIGNKRSHYCTELPPIGWAEGWLDTFISKKHGKVMEKKAPALTPSVLEEVAEIEAQTEEKVEAEKKAA